MKQNGFWAELRDEAVEAASVIWADLKIGGKWIRSRFLPVTRTDLEESFMSLRTDLEGRVERVLSINATQAATIANQAQTIADLQGKLAAQDASTAAAADLQAGVQGVIAEIDAATPPVQVADPVPTPTNQSPSPLSLNNTAGSSLRETPSPPGEGATPTATSQA